MTGGLRQKKTTGFYSWPCGITAFAFGSCRKLLRSQNKNLKAVHFTFSYVYRHDFVYNHFDSSMALCTKLYS